MTEINPTVLLCESHSCFPVSAFIFLYSSLYQARPLPQPSGVMHPVSPNRLLTWHCYRNSGRRPLPSEQVKIPLTESPFLALRVGQDSVPVGSISSDLTKPALGGRFQSTELCCRLSRKYLWPGSRRPLPLTHCTVSF